MAEVTSGSKIADSSLDQRIRAKLSIPSPPSPNPLATLWDGLETEFPGDFAGNPAQTLEWHERRIEVCEREEDWFAGRFHAEQLLLARPSDAVLRQHRARFKQRLLESDRAK